MKQHAGPRFRILLPLASVLSLLAPIAGPLPSAFAVVVPIYVLQTGGNDVGCDGTANVIYPGAGTGIACAKATIQAGVNAVASDGTVNVAAGTYIEQVVIDSKNVALVGAGSDTTFIQAPATLTNDPDGAKTLVLFTGPITAEISGFTVQGPVNGLNFGIYVRAGATANIHNNVIKDIRDEPLSGNQIGVAIEVGKYNDTAPFVNQIGMAAITNNTIFGYQKTGIAIERAGSSATITGNTITGAGPITITAQNGIQIRRGATGTVQTNTITGNAYINPTCGPWDGVPAFCWSAEGIGVLHAGSGVIVQGNFVNHNNSNIYSWKSDGIQILNNQVSDSVTDPYNSAGITVQSDGTPSCCGGSTGNYVTGVTISGNTVQNNLSGGSTQGDGINLYAVNGATVSGNTIAGSYQDGILVGGSGNSTFTANQFSGNGLLSVDPNAAAIDFGGQQGHQGDLNPLGGFTVHNNSFVGNRNAIWNYDSGSLDATSNWWGSATGPGVVGAGDKVSTNVTYNPWYNTSAKTIKTYQVGAGETYTAIQVAISAAASGDTIGVGAGTYPEQIDISKSLTLVGAGSDTTFIQAPATLTNDPDGAKTLVLFTGPITAEFSGFTVQGPVTGLNFGIYIRAGATANIHNNVIKDIRGEPFGSGDSQFGYAIEVGKYNDTFPYVSQIGHATITSNTIIGYQKTGIESEGTGSTATITGNTVTGAGPTTITAQNGIQIRRGATGNIINNVVVGNAYNGPTVSAFGIGVTNAGSGVVIQGNTVHHNGANIYCYGSDAVQVLDNQVSDSYLLDANSYAGIVVLSSGVSAPLNGITISGNTVQNNLSSGSKTDGIDLYHYINSATVSNNVISGHSYDGLWIGWSNGSNINIVGNQFSGNGLSGDDPNAAAIDLGHWYLNTSGGFTVLNNSFVGNRNAIWNYDVDNLDATNNWWGNASGPGSLANIATMPWCTDVSCVTKSNNADLTSLSFSSAALSPTFSSSVTSYTASVDFGVSSVTVTKSTNPGANAVVSGASGLSVGSNIVSITVTSADGTATKTYTVTLTRGAAPEPSSGPPPPPAPPAPPIATIDIPVMHVAKPTEDAKVEATIAISDASDINVAVDVPSGSADRDIAVSISPEVVPIDTSLGMVSMRIKITDAAGASVSHFDKPLTLSLGGTAGGTAVDLVLPANANPVQDVLISLPPAVASTESSWGIVSIDVRITDRTGAQVTQFDKPLTLVLRNVAANTTAAYSQDGLVWTVITKLDGTTLPDGINEGYYIATDGSLVILTRHLTYFGVKKTQAPLVLNANLTQIPLGGFAALSVTGGSGRGDGAYVTSTGSICSINEHGIVTALKAGTCTVTATKTGDGTYLNTLSLPLDLTFIDLTPPAASPVALPIAAVKTITVTKSGASWLIQVNLGTAFAGKTVPIQIRTAGKTTYKTLCVVKLNKAGMVRTTRWSLPVGATIRVLAENRTLVATTAVDLTPPAAVVKTIIVTKPGAFWLIDVNLGPANAGKSLHIQIREVGSTTYQTLSVVKLDKAGMAQLKRWTLPIGATVRVLWKNGTLVSTTVQ